MIRRLYIHNFRCLENFELPIAGRPSTLLIGQNGAGKSTVGTALELLQKMARGASRVGQLVKSSDITRSRLDVPVRFELDIEIEGKLYSYSIAFEYPEGFRELRVFEERLTVDGQIVYSRELAKVHLRKSGQEKEASFFIDWHLVALPIIQQQSTSPPQVLTSDPVSVFRQWLSRTLILRPVPSMIKGDSEEQTLQPEPDATNIGAWFSGLMSHAPSAYSRVYEYLKEVMPDLDDITNPSVGPDSRRMFVQFSNEKGSLRLPLQELSDGEKCFIVSSLVLAANRAYGPLLCFWDEPDNYLAPAEVGHFVMALRRTFQSGGQFIATSHNPETIRRFSNENTLFLYRNSHLEPTIARSLEEVPYSGDIVSSIVRGDLHL